MRGRAKTRMAAATRGVRAASPKRRCSLGLARAAALALGALSALPASAALPGPDLRAPCAERTALRRPFFGDTHVHTALSQDASARGTRATPRDAYRFARGEPIPLPPYDAEGRPTRSLALRRPLDFAVVTDHAEQLGEVTICRDPRHPSYDAWICRLYRRFPRAAFVLMNTKATYFEHPTRFAFCGEGGRLCLDAARGPWREIQDAAEGAYDRSPACRFTTFVGYEWTGATGSRTLHRNVIFRGAAVPPLPTSYFEAQTPEALWRELRRSCLEAGGGCDVLTIPHNSNLSAGRMFLPETADGRPLDAASARERAFFEPLVEVMQHKGDSECQLGGGNEDELCRFEKLSYDDFQGKYVPWLAKAPSPGGFVREALKEGLRVEARVGVDPFKYGLLASTDTHLGAAGATDEDRYPGRGGAGAPAASTTPGQLPDDLELGPGGLAVVWAEENSRDALFDAMRRKEVYGTSSPRIVVRFFGGWSYPEDLCRDPAFVERGYAEGVPMGGDLPPLALRALEPAPRFALSAVADPGTLDAPGLPLQRIQIVKGWVESGVSHERVFDVATSPGMNADVDLATCQPRGEGARSLCSVWEDPDFQPELPAFYYARVVENPSCRWSARFCQARGVDCHDPKTIPPGLEACCAPDHAWTTQERAWTSPIWYTRARTEP